jgi:hypothetical protein
MRMELRGLAAVGAQRRMSRFLCRPSIRFLTLSDPRYRYLDAEARVKKVLASLEKVKEDVGAQVKRAEEAK